MDYLENKACMEDQFSWPSWPLAECKLTFENHALRANTTEIADLWHSHPLACSSHLVIIERLHENKRRERCLMRRRGQKNTSYVSWKQTSFNFHSPFLTRLVTECLEQTTHSFVHSKAHSLVKKSNFASVNLTLIFNTYHEPILTYFIKS